MIALSSLFQFQLLLLLSSFFSFTTATTVHPLLRQQQQQQRHLQQTCVDNQSSGSPNSDDECFLVDATSCTADAPSSPNGCIDLEGTYSYYLQNDAVDGGARSDLYLVVITTNTCGSPCLVRTTDYSNNGRIQTFTCSASTSGDTTTIVFDSNHPRAREIYGSERQEFVFGNGYLTLASKQENCEYLNQTPSPTVTPGNPTVAPTSSPTVGTESPTETPTTASPTVSPTMFTTQPPVPVGGTQSPTESDIEDTTPSPTMTVQTAAPTLATTTEAPDNNTVMPTLAQTTIQTVGPTSGTPTQSPTGLGLPSNCIVDSDIDACLDTDTLQGVSCSLDNQDRVDVTVCTTTPTDSCVEMEVSYNYQNNPDTSIQVSTSVGCTASGGDSCSITVNGQTCASCQVEGVANTNNLEQLVHVSESCGNILLWGLESDTGASGVQTVYLNHNNGLSVGYFPLRSNLATDCQDTTVSQRCFRDTDIPACSYVDSGSGNVIVSDCGDDAAACYDVDVSFDSTTDTSSGCQELQATYAYGQANPTVTITSYESCGADGNTNYCEVEIDGLVCTDCALELDTATIPTSDDTSFPIQKVVVGSSCGDAGGPLEGYLPASLEQTIPYFNAGVGFLRLDTNAVVCLADTVVPTSSPSSTPLTSSPTVETAVSRKFPKDDPKSLLPDETKPKQVGGGGDNAVVLKTTFTLTLPDANGSPTATDIATLWDRTQNFVDDVLTNHYGTSGYLSSEIIAPKQSQLSAQQFELSCILKIYLRESVVAANTQIRTSAQLLSSKPNLQRFVGVFIRYADNNQQTQNGYFYDTQKVFAKLVGGPGVTTAGRRLRNNNNNSGGVVYTGSSS